YKTFNLDLELKRRAQLEARSSEYKYSQSPSYYFIAKRWHERQLDMALASRDKIGEGRACSNLGIVYQLLGEHNAALKLHQAHLSIAQALQDRAGMGRAYGNIGNAYSAMGYYEQAYNLEGYLKCVPIDGTSCPTEVRGGVHKNWSVMYGLLNMTGLAHAPHEAIKYHKQELTISKEVNDRSSEASTHGNLAVAYQALGAHEMALLHYRAHLNTSRELKDTAGEACALLNLANCLSSRAEFAQAVPFYENYLMLSQMKREKYQDIFCTNRAFICVVDQDVGDKKKNYLEICEQPPVEEELKTLDFNETRLDSFLFNIFINAKASRALLSFCKMIFTMFHGNSAAEREKTTLETVKKSEAKKRKFLQQAEEEALALQTEIDLEKKLLKQ
ncbi:unnamed protein product, partial [Timema podura]|nr:unnamed protein product [Timema podura]